MPLGKLEAVSVVDTTFGSPRLMQSRNQHRHTLIWSGGPTLARRAPSDRLAPATLRLGPLRDCFPTPSEGSAISLGAVIGNQ
jgi:hypothetical protein